MLQDRDETRLWGSGTETRRDFGVSRPRRDMRLYISCFGSNQSCGIRVGNRSHVFDWSRNRITFLDMLKPESLF